jgi:hypothetical protein
MTPILQPSDYAKIFVFYKKDLLQIYQICIKSTRSKRSRPMEEYRKEKMNHKQKTKGIQERDSREESKYPSQWSHQLCYGINITGISQDRWQDLPRIYPIDPRQKEG